MTPSLPDHQDISILHSKTSQQLLQNKHNPTSL